MIKPEVKLLIENWKTFTRGGAKVLNETQRIGDFNFDGIAAALINQEVGDINKLTPYISTHDGGEVTERDGVLFYKGIKFEPSEFVKLLKNPNFDKIITQKKTGKSTQPANQQAQQPAQQQSAASPKEKLTNALLERNPSGIGRKNESLVNAFQSMVNNYLDGIWGMTGIKVSSHRNDPKLFSLITKPEIKNIVKDEAKALIGDRINYSMYPKKFEESANKAYDIYTIISKNVSTLKKEYEAANEVKFLITKFGECIKDLNTFYQEAQKFLK